LKRAASGASAAAADRDQQSPTVETPSLGARVLGFDPNALLALNNGALGAAGPAGGRAGAEGALIRALEALGIKLEKRLGRLVEINERLLIKGQPPIFA
jgi:hypothetical protein